MYAEIFNELGINKYVIQIKNLKKYKEPINSYNRSMMIVFSLSVLKTSAR